MVFVGTVNPPAGVWPEAPYTKIDETPVSREKPYLFIDEGGNYFVRTPDLAKRTHGVTWSHSETAGTSIPIERFYLAHPETDTAASINAALYAGKNLLFTPGIYRLEESIRVSRPQTVVLGLGYPTLQPINGTPALVVSDVDGIKLGGFGGWISPKKKADAKSH